MHWEMVVDVLLQSYLLHGDPLGVLQGTDLFEEDDTIPLAYQLLINLIYMRHNDGIRADDTHAGAMMYKFVSNLRKAGKEAGNLEVIQLAAGGRPVSFEALTTFESTRLAIQTFFDTVDWFLETFGTTQPTLGVLQQHFFFDGSGGLKLEPAPGGGGSFRNTRSSGFYQLSLLGEPGDVQVHLIKTYTSWDPNDVLGTVMPTRFALYKFTEVTIPPDDVRRTIVR
jgi:hypothetical protein